MVRERAASLSRRCVARAPTKAAPARAMKSWLRRTLHAPPEMLQRCQSGDSLASSKSPGDPRLAFWRSDVMMDCSNHSQPLVSNLSRQSLDGDCGMDLSQHAPRGNADVSRSPKTRTADAWKRQTLYEAPRADPADAEDRAPADAFWKFETYNRDCAYGR
ncbi:hypothetical protein M885DRAFT_516520 [Pelagophyceae sp. CCMP2097]|nr:hypothetical protein M885DRAFT_516520 [Pelagophyceae sp. CCMP2097]